MIETWSYFTDDEVFGANVKERQSIAAIRGKDDLPDICAQVTSQIRQAYIFSNRELGPDGTIPDGLKFHAIAIATWRFVSEGVPHNDGLQTKARQSANVTAINYLNEIASVKIGKSATPAFGKRGTDLPPRQFTDNTQDG
jgi:hypothetical protein